MPAPHPDAAAKQPSPKAIPHPGVTNSIRICICHVAMWRAKPVSAEASSLALCRTPETMALANPRWSERSEWNLGYESQRIIAHRRCRLTSTRERNIAADRTHLRSSLVFTRHHPTFAALHVGIVNAIVSGVRHSSSKLGSALTCETIRRGSHL